MPKIKLIFHSHPANYSTNYLLKDNLHDYLASSDTNPPVGIKEAEVMYELATL